MSQSHKNQLALLLIEGFGLSPTSTGNALWAANPGAFFDLWRKHPHFALQTISGRENNNDPGTIPETNLATFARGTASETNRQYIDRLIANGSIDETSLLAKSLDQTSVHLSSVHLIGSISKDDSVGSMQHLKAILDKIDEKEVHNIFIHLIIDETIKTRYDLLDLITQFEELASSFSKIQIATIGGIDYFRESAAAKLDKLSAGFRAITRGSNLSALSLSQAISLYLKPAQSPSEIQPISILSGGVPVGRSGDFDLIIFFNHNLHGLERLIFSFVTETGINSKKDLPKSVTALTLAGLHREDRKVASIIERDFSVNLFSTIREAGLHQLIASDSNRSSLIQKCFSAKREGIDEEYVPSPASFDQYISRYQRITNKSAENLFSALSKHSCDFAVLDIPCLDIIAESGSFSDTVVAVRYIDSLIELFVKSASKLGIRVIISSSHGRAEKLARTDAGKTYAATTNPVPFIYIPEKSEANFRTKFHPSHEIMAEVINPKHHIVDIAPTILNLLEVDIPPYMTGKPLIQ